MPVGYNTCSSSAVEDKIKVDLSPSDVTVDDPENGGHLSAVTARFFLLDSIFVPIMKCQQFQVGTFRMGMRLPIMAPY